MPWKKASAGYRNSYSRQLPGTHQTFCETGWQHQNMPFKLPIPTYTSKDHLTMVASIVPLTVYAAYILYGGVVDGAGRWIGVGIMLFAINSSGFFTFGLVALWLQRRLPHDRQIVLRLTVAIALFVLMSVTYLNLLLRLLDQFQVFGYRYNEGHFWRLFAVLGTLNVLLTFVHESINYFERYKAVAEETEDLKKEYTRSRLLGLQSQVNPHFLFNNLNTLSSLIHEDNEQAEAYLDELCKVYRYLLRNNDVQLVALKTELHFLRSYVYLLQQRHGSGLQLITNVAPHQLQLEIPPLTLQMILENIISTNSLSKTAPLVIHINSDEENWLQVRNNAQPRLGSETNGIDAGLDNIVNKIHLLCREEVSIRSNATERVIHIPLIACKEEVAP